MLSAVTVSLVSAARGGPFVFWDDLAAAFQQAHELGFDAVEIFAPGPRAIPCGDVQRLVDRHGLEVAAVGTGAGKVLQNLTLTDPDPARRAQAVDFVHQMIDFGAEFAAPAIIGSMQGRSGENASQDQALAWLQAALDELGDHAGERCVPLIYEPLNRYETNLINRLSDGVQLLTRLRTDNVRLLADLFHMNIEEADIAAALRAAGPAIGHVHFVDSNRQAAGLGHIDYQPIAAALKEISYSGYASAEALPLPDSHAAAAQTMQAFQKWFGSDHAA